MAQPQVMTEDTVFKDILSLPKSLPPVVGLGPFLKATITVIAGDKAYVTHDCGDLGTPEAIELFEQTLDRALDETGIDPVAYAHDLHPDFYSSRFAEQTGKPTIAVQHHHAHVAALAAEHGFEGPILGAALDGFGLGPNNQSWGGELILAEGADYQRLGHLSLLQQPGGDVAAREPWRMAAAALHAMGRGDDIATRFKDFKHGAMLGQMLAKDINSPKTSSCGRLFDAACGLVGLHLISDFEGQAPIAFEKLVDQPKVLDGGWQLSDDGLLDMTRTLEALIDLDMRDGANLFHGTLAAALADWMMAAARRSGVKTLGLCGGCFFNQVLKADLTQRLEGAGFTVLSPQIMSPGDPAISLGQAWVAAHSDPAPAFY